MARLESLLLSIWIGGMIAIGYLAAPVLFTQLEDRALAGALAGEMFSWVSHIGLFCGALLLVLMVLTSKQVLLRAWRFWVLLIMVACIASLLYVVQPMMAQLKLEGLVPGTEAARQFGTLHGVSSVLYLVTSVFGVILILAGMRPKTRM